MTDRTVSVRLQAQVSDYLAKFSAAGRATTDLANKVDIAKGKAAQGYHAIGVAGVAVGAAVAGGFLVAVKSMADFEAKMALVRTLSHATTGEMKQLRDAALHVGQAYGFSATQVADAEAELVKAGVSVADIMGGALTGALTLAAAGQTDVATATTIAATAMTQFQLKGSDVPHIADLLAGGADKALGSVVDLGYALDQAGPQAHQFGVSIEETVGTLAAFAQAGQIGERGGTVFSQMLIKLAAPGKQASDIMQSLGLSVYNTKGQFVGMANLAGQLHDKLGSLTEAERNHDLAVIFGQRAIRGANILYQDGAQGITYWTKRVDDAGFASLQAAGKLDSLSGDVTKLKTELQTAFIGVGEGANGPLRNLVQDVTDVTKAWNSLPGPVRDSAEALIAAGGAVTLLGGAALLFIPKWTAMNAALESTGLSAISASSALATIAKGGAVVAGVVAIDTALQPLIKHLKETPVAASALTGALVDLARTGSTTDKTFQDVLSKADTYVRIVKGGSATGPARDAVASLDQALSDLVTSGHLDDAQAAFTVISKSMQAAGGSTQQITGLFPKLSDALASSASSAKVAGNGIDQYGNKVGGAAQKTRSATDAAKAYGNALHALADPLFAMNSSLQAVVTAQHAVNDAIHKYGAASPQARQANLDLASASLDAEAAARTLAAAVKDGSVSIGGARKYLHAWVADGLLTKQSADDVKQSFQFLIDKADTISGLHPHLRVTADTSQADAALNALFDHIGQVLGAALPFAGSTSSSPKFGLADFGPAAKHHPSAGGTASNGGTTSPGMGGLYGGGGTAGSTSSAGSGGGSASTTKPPTTAEIVQAILTGTIPPSIDKLSKTLQDEIRHLSTVVASAEQYRASVLSSLLSWASLSNNTAQTDSFGNSMGAPKVNTYLSSRAAKLAEFVRLRNALRRNGASPDLLAEFTSPDDNAAMQQELQGGKAGIRRSDRLEARIHHLAGQAATQATNDMYGKQLMRGLDRLPKAVESGVVKGMSKVHLTIDMREHDRHQGKKIRQSG